MRKIVMQNILDQTKFELIGGAWVDEKDNYHAVGLITTDRGHIIPDYPKMEDVYIKQVYQLGLSWNSTKPTNTKLK